MNDTMKAVEDICATIAKKVDRAYVLEHEKKREKPEKLWKLWADTGLLSIGLPEEYGGAGGKFTEVVYAHDLLHRQGLFLPLTIPNYMVRTPILKHGTEEQKQKYLPPTATGESFYAFAITEADAGTNTFKIRTKATRSASGDYVINGQKCFITAMDEADYALVVVRTSPPDPGARTSGLSLLIVDTKAKGISMTQMDIAMYMPEKNFVVNFDDVVVPAENLLGQEGRGIEALFDCLNPERLMMAAQAVGMADYVLNRAVEYAKVRAPFKAPIGSYQSIQHPMAIAKTRIEAARLMLYSAVQKYDTGAKVGVETNMVKFLASDAFKLATDIAATAYGGSFTDLSQDIIPFYLKAKMWENGPLNNNMVLCFIAQEALGLPKSY